MKTLFFISTIIFSLNISFGQTNLYFQNNPIWQDQSLCAVPHPCIQNETMIYYVNGDTIINTMTYKKIYKKGQGVYNWMALPPANCSGSYLYIDTVPSYFLRSYEKEIYLRQPIDTSEYLLYDFNLIVGDTLPDTYNNEFSNIITVSEIDSINTPYGFLKRFTLAGNTSAQYLIEGVGSSNGLFAPIGVMFECGYNQICYSLNDTAYYPNSGPTCDIALEIELPNNFQKPLFFPNPFSVQSVLNIDQPLQNASLLVYNSFGSLVKEIKNISGQTVLFSRENLASGLYFLQLKQVNKTLATYKLVIIN